MMPGIYPLRDEGMAGWLRALADKIAAERDAKIEAKAEKIAAELERTDEK